MKEPILYLFVIGLFCTHSIRAQNYFGVLPKVSISKQVETRWKVSLQVETMHGIGLLGPFIADDLQAPGYIRTDITWNGTFRMSPLANLSGGYMIRSQINGKFAHRSIIQYTFAQNLSALKLAHRFRTDQTFRRDQSPQLRLRYRLSSEIPLAGQDLNQQEFYVKGSLEPIFSWLSQTFNLEQRFGVALGYHMTNKQKLEIGLDHRLDQFKKTTNRHRLWLTFNYYLSL